VKRICQPRPLGRHWRGESATFPMESWHGPMNGDEDSKMQI
jgi:hypothetical protein